MANLETRLAKLEALNASADPAKVVFVSWWPSLEGGNDEFVAALFPDGMTLRREPGASESEFTTRTNSARNASNA